MTCNEEEASVVGGVWCERSVEWPARTTVLGKLGNCHLVCGRLPDPASEARFPFNWGFCRSRRIGA